MLRTGRQPIAACQARGSESYSAASGRRSRRAAAARRGEAEMTIFRHGTRTGVLTAALLLAAPGWAADTDVENPNMPELPLQRGGPIMGGRQHQPTPSEIEERAQLLRSQPGAQASETPAPVAKPSANDDLYQRVLRQSQHATPRVLDPSGQ